MTIGDRVRVTNYGSNFSGRIGTIVARLDDMGDWLPWNVLIDDYDGNPMPFGTRELTRIEEDQ